MRVTVSKFFKIILKEKINIEFTILSFFRIVTYFFKHDLEGV